MRNIVSLVALFFLLGCSQQPAFPADALATKAQAILKEHCYSCHGEGGAAEGGVNYVLDVQRLVSRGKLVPKNSAKSKLYTQVKTGNMPKDSEPLSKADIETLKQWIDAGASDFNPPVAPREFISPAKMFDFMQADLQSLDARKRPLIRYFTLTHLYNAGLKDDELATYRNGLIKLINSLSWAPDIVVPKAIDPAKTIFRLDIGDIEWSDATWDRILSENPYGVTYTTASATTCYQQCKTQQPFVRGDWFVARASVPPLYHDILDLPKTDLALEQKLQVNVLRNLQTDKAARAGFNGSGVSTNNRLVERHRANLTGGAYWKSYDFGGNDGTKNLFANPIGKNGRDTFVADGGELIFSLPNGLQAYMLIDGKGGRIDKGPINVVSDPKRPDKAVVNGLSCMSCHAKDMIEKKDEVRAAVLGNPNGYTADVLESVKALYPTADEFEKLVALDKARFAKAVEATGGILGETEPIVTLALRFEELLDLPLAAAEAGVSSDEFKRGLSRSSELASIFGALNVGGTVQREVYLANFALIVRDLKLGTYVGKGGTPPRRPDTNLIGQAAGDLRVIKVKGIETRWRWIPAGKFKMGSPVGEQGRDSDEAQIDVTISKGFWMLETEVTQQLWTAVMGTAIEQQQSKASGSKLYGSGPKHPMYYVSHEDATEFCVKFNALLKSLPDASGLSVRLPTEAEWEYAARAGTTTRYYWGDSDSQADAYVWHEGNSNGGTQPVGQKKENVWGLKDMSGNVWEWCSDGYSEKLVGGTDPRGALSASDRVVRGGSWSNSVGSGFLRSAGRDGLSPGFRFYFLGFRVACSSVGG